MYQLYLNLYKIMISMAFAMQKPVTVPMKITKILCDLQAQKHTYEPMKPIRDHLIKK